MAYLVLARKYRPGTLAELVGQEHIARALSNAIAMQRIPHALLFCGARGTGKTSTARIVAKMLNCVTGPTATPCGTCSPCREIAAGNCMDVQELDAASNRGIDEIRELRSGVGYAPSRDRSKIYIIDEAHMLTNEAANAFLKTLEEPPSHVVFILATTDPQRLPVTIRSRCQRYDFRRVRAGDVVKLLRSICTSEGVKADDAALYLVAREGDGSMRDSLSVLDQVIAFGGAEMDAESVAALLGVADRNRAHQLLQALCNREANTALQAVAAAHDHGMDLRTFARTMAMEARDLLVTRLAGGAARDLVDRAESEIETLQKLAEGLQIPELERLSHVLLELAEQVAKARHPRLVLELGMVRLCRAAPLVDVAELVVRVENLLAGGRNFGGGGGGSGGGRPGGGSFGGGGGGTPRPLLAQGQEPALTPVGERLADSPRSQSSAFPVRAPAPAPAPAPVLARAPAAVSAAAPVAMPEPASWRPLADADLEPWQHTIRTELQKPVVATLLDNAVIVHAANGRIRLGFSSEFWTGQAKQAETLRTLEEGARRAFAAPWHLEIGETEPRARTESPSARRAHKEQAQRQADAAQVMQHDRVRMLVDALDGQIIRTGDAPS